LSNNNIVKNNIVFGSGRGDIALGGPVSFGNCFEENIYNHSSPVLLEFFQGCDNFRYPYTADLSSTIGLLSLFVQVNMGDFEKISYKNQPIPSEQPTMPLELTKIIEPAIGMFEKSKKYIELAKYPEESDTILKSYYASQRSYSSPLKPQFPQTYKTILYHIFGFILPIGLYIAWIGTSIIDIIFNKKLTKNKSIIYLIAILMIPYISAIVYLYKESSISKYVRSTMIITGIILFLGLIAYSIVGIIIGGIPTQ
ncbi:MAG: plastocyanin, partial [Spirochaetia bacterium]|nr:plastocyanin [Spirochaetia bacterium]